MASDSRTEAAEAEQSARAIGLALDAIEAELAALEPGASVDVIARKLAGPVRAFDAAAKAASGESA
jgi:hypothetical protein